MKERARHHDDLLKRGWPVVAARMKHSGDEVVPHHTPVTHSYATLIFVTGGRTRMELNGEWNLREGDLVVMPAGAPHRALERKGFEAWGVGFCVSCFAANGVTELLEPFERVRSGASAVVHIPGERRAYLGGLFSELERTGPQRGGVSASLDAVQRSLLTLILAEVEAHASTMAPASSNSVVVDALRFIERNCLKPLTLQDVAKAVRRSPAWVTTALKRETGKSAVAWIVSGRMAEARRL
ncbi:MAG: cupin domain-containing protein, partial [Archangium sp.]